MERIYIMIFSILMLGIAMLILVIVYFVDLSSTKFQKNRYVGVTFPEEYKNHQGVIAIVNEYKRNLKLYVLSGFMIGVLGMILFHKTGSIILFFFLYVSAIIYFENKLYRIYFSKLYQFKCNNSIEVDFDKDEDNDRYWKTGFYNNPGDSRLMVEKRIGIGTELNIGNKKGKVVIGSICLFMIGLVLFVLIPLIKLDFQGFHMELSNKELLINSPMYGKSISYGDIQEVYLEDDIDVQYKSNGASTDEYAIGYFKIKDYGKVLLYVHKGVSPYLALKTEDGYVFYNGTTKEETQKVYEELMNQLGE